MSRTHDPIASATPIRAADPANAVWRLTCDRLWGEGKKQEPRSLTLDLRVNAGRVAAGAGTGFNASPLPVLGSDLVFTAGSVRGTVRLLITPDGWIPEGGQPIEFVVDVDANVLTGAGNCTLAGSYTARRVDGRPLHGEQSHRTGTLTGATRIEAPPPDDVVWTFRLNQVPEPGGVDLDALIVALGIVDGTVRWGAIGLAAETKFPPNRQVPFDVSGFAPLDAFGRLHGRARLSARDVHVANDPDQVIGLEFTAVRIADRLAAEASLVPDQGRTRRAFGLGAQQIGGGAIAPHGLWVCEREARPWWTPVTGHRAPAAGEHPRLLFRREDIPALRQRAQTPEGAAILARLRRLLGCDGEALTGLFSQTPPHHRNTAAPLPVGAFTIFHGAGFGLLHVVTGEQKYADLARASIEAMFAGRYDIDNRYSWVMPGSDLRCGRCLPGMAYAYDLCHDAWPEDFRRRVARALQDYDQPIASGGRVTLAHLTGRSRKPPGSNHYGAVIGGAGLALLAILDDPGTDAAFVSARLAEAEANLARALELGFGDAGWFAEGFGSSSSLSRIPLMEFILAERLVRGRDYRQPRPNAAWLALTWLMHLGGDGHASMPNRGAYQTDDDVLRDGEVATGMALVDPRFRPALAWMQRTFIAPGEARDDLGLRPGEESYGAQRYPIGAVHAFLGWPIGAAIRPPDGLLPLTAVDTIHGYFVARNRWRDRDDIIITHWLDYGPKGYYGTRSFKPDQAVGLVRVWGFGLRATMATSLIGGPVTRYTAATDGSFAFTRGEGVGASALAVDLSGASGAEAVVVAIGPQAGQTGSTLSNGRATTRSAQLVLDGLPVNVLTLQTGTPPDIRVEGRSIRIGDQHFTWDGATLCARAFAARA